MKRFIICLKSARSWERIAAALLWLTVWQLAAMAIKQEMLLASPVSVALRICELAVTPVFWRSVAFSLSRVVLGFILAFTAGTLMAASAYRWRAADVIFEPFISVTKAAPVASYIILCLLFMPSRRLSTCVAFIMSLPVIYTNLLEGLHSIDEKLLEMAAVFRIPTFKRIIYIYLSGLMPFLVSACSLSLGICWKSGIAAEVIGLPLGSIGEKMYQAKIFVDTPTLLAWTAVVILVSFLLEKVFIAAIRGFAAHVDRM